MSVKLLLPFALFISLLSCKDNSIPKGDVFVSDNNIDFGEISRNQPSDPVSVTIYGKYVCKEVVIKTTGDFELSIDETHYSTSATIPADAVNKRLVLYIRCNPKSMGELSGALYVKGENFESVEVPLSAVAMDMIKVTAFDDERLAYGGGYKQSMVKVVNFPVQPEDVKKITMYIKLRCPHEGCNKWDMYANIKVEGPESGKWMEMGRYITPYGVDNHQREKGFDIDVTDFKSLLTGDVSLKAFIEVWAKDGWLLSVNFEILKGAPDYKYYALTPILEYDDNSLAGIPYGIENSFDVEKCITVPVNAEQTELRTIITGWGHACPKDPDGRPCAEWCFRTHHILIDGVPFFTHEMKGIGCSRNPVKPQGGNWAPDRAGWCPGMEIPVRKDVFSDPMAGMEFCYKYELEPWTNNLSNGKAYYAISSFVVVKSNTPIEKPTVE